MTSMVALFRHVRPAGRRTLCLTCVVPTPVRLVHGSAPETMLVEVASTAMLTVPPSSTVDSWRPVGPALATRTGDPPLSVNAESAFSSATRAAMSAGGTPGVLNAWLSECVPALSMTSTSRLSSDPYTPAPIPPWNTVMPWVTKSQVRTPR